MNQLNERRGCDTLRRLQDVKHKVLVVYPHKCTGCPRSPQRPILERIESSEFSQQSY